MSTEKIEPFAVIGIAAKTTNKDGQSGRDIGGLWQRFFADGIMEKIPHKLSSDVFLIYTDYESDHTGLYTAIVGCKVRDLSSIPDGCTGKTIGSGLYTKYSPQGKMPDIVYNLWQKIWNSDIPRAYTADFEVYGEKSQDWNNAEVDVYLAVKHTVQ